MPIISIRSLPFESSFDVSEAIEGLMSDFANDTAISLEHISATWEFIEAGNYGVAGKAAWNQPHKTHPVLVELLAPDLHDEVAVSGMLECVAASISRQTGIEVSNIFIHHSAVRSGSVYEAGAIVRW